LVEDEPTSSDLPGWELVFRFTPGRPCLSFCATVGERWRRGFERLRTPADLGRWLLEAGITDHAPSATTEQLSRARELREAIYRSVRAGMAGISMADGDRQLINEVARQPAVSPQIASSGDRRHAAGPDPVGAGLATVAADAVDLLTSPALTRVKECDAPDCALLFLDTSRPGRRRWCSDTACGTRARTAAYRLRRQEAPAPEVAPAPTARNTPVAATSPGPGSRPDV
jgi:predicted RNA-binding Zn ribbon-like protein